MTRIPNRPLPLRIVSALIAITSACVPASAAHAAAPAGQTAGHAPHWAGQAAFNDPRITRAIDQRIFEDSALPWRSIEVTTSGGIVTLAGSVHNLLAKERAALLAESICGVRAVVNTITVRAPFRGDDEIQKDVVAALAADYATDAREIAVEVNGGGVTLTGNVDSFRERRLAGEVAKGVNGVREVRQRLEVRFDKNPQRSDGVVAAEIKGGLENDVWIDADQIMVGVRNRTAILTGRIGSAAAKLRVEAKAWVSGIATLDASGLSVDPGLRHRDRKPPGHAVRTDAELAHTIETALLYDPRVYSFNPEIDVSDGFVTLSGTVNNFRAREAAGQDARNTVGVNGVANHIEVRSAWALDAQAMSRYTAAAHANSVRILPATRSRLCSRIALESRLSRALRSGPGNSSACHRPGAY